MSSSFQCDHDIQGFGAAHAISHVVNKSEVDVVTAVQEEARRLAPTLTRWYAKALRRRQISYEEFVAQIDIQKGWFEDDMFLMVAAIANVLHIAVFTPDGAWCTTRTGSTAYALVYLLQCHNEDEEVVYIPFTHNKVIQLGDEMSASVDVKTAMVRQIIAAQLAEVEVAGYDEKCAFVAEHCDVFLSPKPFIMKVESDGSAEMQSSFEEPTIVQGGREMDFDHVVCKYCRKVFKFAKTLRAHIVRLHPQYAFVCKVQDCVKSYTTGVSLRRHVRMYHGQGSYMCQVCGKRFLHRNQLLKHEEYHLPYE